MRVFIDIETRKVPILGPPFYMPNGERLRTRWQAFAVGIAREDGQVYTLDSRGMGEHEFLSAVGQYLAGATEVVYCATREFDEMVLKGRFTNARRAHLPAREFPAVPGAESLHWRNVRKEGRRMPERPGKQIPSKDVPAAWAAGRHAEVLAHLEWDVEQLVEVSK